MFQKNDALNDNENEGGDTYQRSFELSKKHTEPKHILNPFAIKKKTILMANGGRDLMSRAREQR